MKSYLSFKYYLDNTEMFPPMRKIFGVWIWKLNEINQITSKWMYLILNTSQLKKQSTKLRIEVMKPDCSKEF